MILRHVHAQILTHSTPKGLPTSPGVHDVIIGDKRENFWSTTLYRQEVDLNLSFDWQSSNHTTASMLQLVAPMTIVSLECKTIHNNEVVRALG